MSQYSEKEIALLRESGARLALILREVRERVAPGVSTAELDAYATARVYELGDTPAFLGYQPRGASRPYPAAMCISVNDEVVHGIPNEDPRILAEGDIVTLDMGLTHEGYTTDSAISVAVGTADAQGEALMAVTKQALDAAIAAVHDGARVGDLGAAVEAVVKKGGMTVIKELGGHGVGRSVHEEPFVPNHGKAGTGTALTAGEVIAIEPIITEGNGKIYLKDDGYTYATSDGTRAAQFEHTVLVTKRGAEILTQ